MPSRRKLIGRKLERRVVGQATLLALLQPAAEAGCVALELKKELVLGTVHASIVRPYSGLGIILRFYRKNMGSTMKG